MWVITKEVNKGTELGFAIARQDYRQKRGWFYSSQLYQGNSNRLSSHA